MVFSALWLCLSCLAAQAADEVRTWTDVQGRTMQAVFLREVDGDVSFLKDGKLTIIPLEKLSEKDQKLIRELESSRKVVEEARPAGAPRSDAPASVTNPFESPFGPASAKSPKSDAGGKQAATDIRVWRDEFGNQISGRFVRVHEGNVIVSRAGRVQSLPFKSLSREDRQYVRDLLVARGEGALAAQLPPEESPSPANAGPAVAANAPQAAPGFPADTGPATAGNAPMPQPSVPAPATSAPYEAGPPQIVASIPNPTFETPQPQPTTGRKAQREINIAAFVIGLPIGAAIGSLIGAVILRAAT